MDGQSTIATIIITVAAASTNYNYFNDLCKKIKCIFFQ